MTTAIGVGGAGGSGNADGQAAGGGGTPDGGMPGAGTSGVSYASDRAKF